ncbi:hypothetical protein Tco_0812776 [Tanacetum coccineum]
MPPRRLKKKSIKKLVEKCMAKAIEEYEKSRANLDSAGSSGGNPGNSLGEIFQVLSYLSRITICLLVNHSYIQDLVSEFFQKLIQN